MIDLVKSTVLTILNKENNGYITPAEFNMLANNVQYEIYRDYFENINRDTVRDNRGFSSSGYGNLPFKERQRITKFATASSITKSNGVFSLPSNLYFIEQDGVTTASNKVVEEVERSSMAYLQGSSAAPTTAHPVYESMGDSISVLPSTVESINLRYLRKPLKPNWTYMSVGGDPLFNISDNSYQDFELHASEFSNIVNRMLVYFGINLREAQIVQVAEGLKDTQKLKENN
tara:strand:- start:1429 stop:2121 length:693 start_codon:yes stop_codon:yes gene_type:complete